MSVDPAWKGVYKAGGVSLLIMGVLFFITLLSFAILQPPMTAEAALENPSVSWSYVPLTVGNVLFIPGVLALYLALKEVNKNRMLIATGLAGVGIPLMLADSILFFSLVTLSNGYMAATSEALRAAYVAAADLALGAALAFEGLAIILFNVSTIIMSLVMLKGIFSKGTAYLGIAAGIVGLVSTVWYVVPVLLIFMVVALISMVLVAIWYLAVGYRLYKLG
ncbi:MAG: hypothetical protein ACE5KU_04400 [Nitrososphaerales archaeon]